MLCKYDDPSVNSEYEIQPRGNSARVTDSDVYLIGPTDQNTFHLMQVKISRTYYTHIDVWKIYERIFAKLKMNQGTKVKTIAG